MNRRAMTRWRQRLANLLDQLDDRATDKRERAFLSELRKVCDLDAWGWARNLAAALRACVDHGTGYKGCGVLLDEVELACCALASCESLGVLK